jgi:putative ABC transport system permease protein
MFKHMMKLIWNRKGAHGLIIAEITIAFLVVFGVASLGYSNYHLYQQPLGFNWENGLHVSIRTGGDWTEQDGKSLEQSLSVLENHPQVASASGLLFGPFRGWRSTTNFKWGETEIDAVQNRFTDGAHEAMGLELVEGRWTGPEDIGLSWNSVVINRVMAEKLFPNESPLGKNINPPDEEDDNFREVRVVGVFEDFRQMGEFSDLFSYAIHRFPLEEYEQRAFSIIIYPQPGADVSLQEEILNTVQRVAPNWTTEIKELSVMRKSMLDQVLTPFSILSLVAGFLILMVGFGLFGVLWQSVT